MIRKKILLNAFNMNSIGHIHHGMWTHPRDQSDRYNTIEYWTHIARVLERGFFDGLFIADIIGYYDVFEGNVDLTLKEAIQLPVNDPWTLVSAMAAVTEHLGFGVTANIHTETPYSFARKVSSLDHLTRGRLGWNIVTGYLDSGARAMGRDGLDEHDKRYDRADDFLQLCYKLWEGSWEDGAIIRDRNGRIYTDPNKVHAVAHNGPYYRAHGYHSSEPSPQRTPVLYQAGSSGRGRQFASRHAECVFIAASDPATAKAASTKLRQDFVNAGRRADDVKIFVGIAVITGQTQGQALEKYEDYLRYASAQAGVAHFSASTGIDFSRFGLDEPISYGQSTPCSLPLRLPASRAGRGAICSTSTSLAAATPRLLEMPARWPTNWSAGLTRVILMDSICHVSLCPKPTRILSILLFPNCRPEDAIKRPMNQAPCVTSYLNGARPCPAHTSHRNGAISIRQALINRRQALPLP